MKYRPKRIKNLIILTGGIVLVSGFLFCQKSIAYDSQTTHPALTREIIDFYELSFDKKLTNEQEQWIISGSSEEDRAPRWLNHFYDPVFKRGLTTSILGIGGYPSKDWARFSSYQTRSIANISTWWGDFSYETAVKNYSENKEKDAYIDLGHILHLIEDITVPEHARNDIHFSDSFTMQSFYEDWAMRNSGGLTQDLAKRLFIKGNKPVIYSDLEVYFNQLANYSNNYFFSPRTINSEIYLKPKVVYEDGTFAYGKDENGEFFDLAQVINDKHNTNYFLNNSQILQEYWLHLSRQAIINGAGVIQLFLNQGELARQEVNKINPQKTSLLSQIYGFFAGLFGQKNEPDMVITNEFAPQSPQSQTKSSVSNSSTAKTTSKTVATITEKPKISVLPAKPIQPAAATSTVQQQPQLQVQSQVSTSQVNTPIVYGGGGGSTSLTTSGSSNLTPASDTPAAPTFQTGDLVINEIMYNLEGTDDKHEWIEIYNNSSREIVLTGGSDGWKFYDGADSLHRLNEPATQGSMVISSGGYIVLAGDATTFLSDHAGFSGTVIDTVMSLKNSTSTLKIIAPDGTVIDEVTYYNSWGADGDGKTLERKSAAGSSNDAENWAVSTAPGGTPGAANNWEISAPDADNSATTTLGLGTDVPLTTVITENTTWTLAGSPYRLFFDGQRRPTVAAGAVLTIAPGVKIIPQGGNYTALEIRGTLNAIATSGAPIIFTSATPQAGEWLNIAFSQGSQGNLDYVEFRYGGQGLERPVKEMVKVVGATININHSKFENAQGIALRLVDSNGVVENSTFSDNACGISVDSLVNGDGTTDGGCYGAHSFYSQAAAETAPQIRNNQFIRNRIIAIETRNGATPILNGNIFIDNNYPVRIESSYPSITNSQVANSASGFLGGIAISGSTHFSKNYTLKKDLPYILEVSGPSISPFVDSGATLTIEPGVILKPNHSYPAMYVNGALAAQGTAENPVIFTSFKDDTKGGDTNGDGSNSSPQNNDWANIKFFTGSIGRFVNALFSYSGYGYIAPPALPANEISIENFDSYSVGALSGQGDWGAGNPSDQIFVDNTFAHDGSNSAKLSGGSSAYTYRVLTQPITESGTLSYWIYYSSLGNQSISIADSNGNTIANIYYDYNNHNCSTSDGNCWALMGDGGMGHFVRTNIQTTISAWHFIELEISFSNQEVRMRQDAGNWSDWVVSNRTNFGRIRFDRGYGDVFYDSFVYTKPALIVPSNPALSIDSGATVVVQ